jgi:hypothetical protein
MAGMLCYFWVFKNYKIYPWDNPLLYSFFTFPNHYKWGFDSDLPFVGLWLFFIIMAGNVIAIFYTQWIKRVVGAQIFLVLIVGMYQTTNWLSFHTRANVNLSVSSRGISSLLRDQRAGGGVFISDGRYGSMSYVLYGLANAPKVIVRPEMEEISQTDVQGYDWVLVGKQYAQNFYYSSKLVMDGFTLYLIDSKISSQEYKKELLRPGNEIILPLGTARNVGLRLHGYNAQEEWGAATAQATSSVELPFLIKGAVHLRVFGWVPRENPSRKLGLYAGGASTNLILGEVPAEHEVTIQLNHPSDSIELEIPTIHQANESRDVGAAIGYIKVEALTK